MKFLYSKASLYCGSFYKKRSRWRDHRVWTMCNYRPQTKLRKGNVFIPVCDSVHGVGGGRCTPPSRQTPLPGRPLQRTVRILLECILVNRIKMGRHVQGLVKSFEISQEWLFSLVHFLLLPCENINCGLILTWQVLCHALFVANVRALFVFCWIPAWADTRWRSSSVWNH